MSQNIRAVLVNGDDTMLDGRNTVRTPPNGMGDLGLLVNALGARLSSGQEVTVLIGADTAERMQFEPELPAVARTGKKMSSNGLDDHPVLAGPRSAGWRVSHADAWMTFHIADGPAVHLGVLPWIEQRMQKEGTRDHFPLWDSTPGKERESLRRLVSWHRYTNTAWRSSPGMTGIAMIRNGHFQRADKRTAPTADGEPTWRPPNFENMTPARSITELDYLPNQWSRPREDGEPDELIGLDANRMYLAAALSVNLPRYALRRTGRMAYSPKLSGYWSIKPLAWNDSRLPDPGGYRRRDAVGCQWITSPTMGLLVELAEAGLCDHPEVVDSYTSAGVQLLRPWGELVKQGLWDSEKDPRLVTAFKRVYTETIGMFNNKRSRIYRPDWHHTIIAQARVNLWRKLRAASLAGLYPRWIETDCVVYPKFDLDEIEKYSLKLGTGLGMFKVTEVAA